MKIADYLVERLRPEESKPTGVVAGDGGEHWFVESKICGYVWIATWRDRRSAFTGSASRYTRLKATFFMVVLYLLRPRLRPLRIRKRWIRNG